MNNLKVASCRSARRHIYIHAERVPPAVPSDQHKDVVFIFIFFFLKPGFPPERISTGHHNPVMVSYPSMSDVASDAECELTRPSHNCSYLPCRGSSFFQPTMSQTRQSRLQARDTQPNRNAKVSTKRESPGERQGLTEPESPDTTAQINGQRRKANRVPFFLIYLATQGNKSRNQLKKS